MKEKMNKQSIIIFGLGEQYKLRKHYLENVFDIVGYCDSKKMDVNDFIPLEKLYYTTQKIYITSNKYYDEIKSFLINECHIAKDRIIGEKDTCWFIDNSLVRDKWVERNLKNIASGKILLDAGVGELRYKKYCNHLTYISQDFGAYDPSKWSEGLQLDAWDVSKVDIISDITEIPLENNAVDAILCTEVFEHIKNPILALKEFSRLLKTGGTLLLTAPFCSLTHFAPYHFASGFNKYWYEENLSDFGFKIEEIMANGNYFDYLRQELLRLPYMMCEINEKQNYDSIELNDAIMHTLILLEEFSKKDLNSSEILCFGYMVKATKIF